MHVKGNKVSKTMYKEEEDSEDDDKYGDGDSGTNNCQSK